MDPNSIIGRVVAQVGQQQMPQSSPAFAPIREMLNSPRRVEGANSMRELRGAYGPPGLDYNGQEAFARAQEVQQYLSVMARYYGPPPADATTTEQQYNHYRRLQEYYSTIGMRPTQGGV